MIDNNEDCVTKSNLQKQETHLPNIMIGAGQQSNKETIKQTQRHRNWRTFRQKSKKTYLQITQADLQWTYAH